MVERILGKAEVGSSILPGGTIRGAWTPVRAPLFLHEVVSFDGAAARWPGEAVFKPFIAIVAALALAASAAAQTPPELPRPVDGYFQEPVSLAPGVWVLMEPRFQVQPIGNVTVIEQSDGLVLIDAGGSPGAGRRIAAMVKALSPKPVKAIVITHWHGDHPQGLSALLEAWPHARTIATRTTQANLRDSQTMNTPGQPDSVANAALRKQLEGVVAYSRKMAAEAADARVKAGWAATERQFNQYGLDMDGAVTLSVAEGFDDLLVLPDAEAPVELRFLGRANTDGDAVAWLPRQRIVVTGDIVVAPLPFGFGSYPTDWIAALGRIRALDFGILVPGHGPPQRDRAYIDRLAAALGEVRAKVAALAGQGLTLDEARTRLDLSAQARGFVGDDPWLSHWFDQYWTRPIAASAYKEAKGQPIVQSLKGS